MNMFLYDTTLRDGTQREGLSLSVDDKVKIARRLDDLGIHISKAAGRARTPRTRSSSVVSGRSGSGMRRSQPSDDPAGPTAGARTIQSHCATRSRDAGGDNRGKSSTLHVERVLETSRDENLGMISETVGYFRRLGREVIYDAEHFFDGYRLDATMRSPRCGRRLARARTASSLCDTNGGELPES